MAAITSAQHKNGSHSVKTEQRYKNITMWNRRKCVTLSSKSGAAMKIPAESRVNHLLLAMTGGGETKQITEARETCWLTGADSGPGWQKHHTVTGKKEEEEEDEGKHRGDSHCITNTSESGGGGLGGSWLLVGPMSSCGLTTGSGNRLGQGRWA